MSTAKKRAWILVAVVGTLLALTSPAGADVVTDWNKKACDLAFEAKLPSPMAYGAMAVVQVAVYEAVNAITHRYPAGALNVTGTPSASIDAAVAAATRATLTKYLPAHQTAVEEAYAAALAKIAEGAAKTEGVAIGERAAAAVMSSRPGDFLPMEDSYRPLTTPGVYVPTVIPLARRWYQRKPWLMSRARQFRPGPPPKLSSKTWARDYNEIKAVGRKNSTTRTAEQTEIARFWEATTPAIYHGVVRSVAEAPGRDVTQNARLLAAMCQGMEDALIAVFDAKYHYALWRPVTAIRNGDKDGNQATVRDSTWLPFIETPMHPEYPCAHCILSAMVGTVLRAEIGAGSAVTLKTTSPTANGASRSWTSIDDFIQEVANARIYDGVHFRNSTEVGTAMGKKVGELVVSKLLTGPK